MEPVTHALSGAVIGQLFAARPGTGKWLPLWAALVAASPDIDIFFVRTPLEYIEWHRGITHSLIGGLGLALFCALPYRWLPRLKEGTPALLLWFWGYLLILHHIWLDCMNSYGTQVLLPFSDLRIRWNALFIVDPLLLIPLGAGLLLRRTRRPVMLGLLLWTILYPLGSLGLRMILERHIETAHPQQILQTAAHETGLPPLNTGTWRQEGLHLVPDAFTPFHWKLVLDRGPLWDVAGYTPFRDTPTTYTSFPKPPQPLWDELGAKDRTFHVYQRFALFPALDERISIPGAPGSPTEYVFSDLRFGSTIPFVDAIQTRRGGKAISFRIMARVDKDGVLSSVRFVTTEGAGGDSGWHAPQPPEN